MCRLPSVDLVLNKNTQMLNKLKEQVFSNLPLPYKSGLRIDNTIVFFFSAVNFVSKIKHKTPGYQSVNSLIQCCGSGSGRIFIIFWIRRDLHNVSSVYFLHIQSYKF
jgi:hypothetical protein